ncbi:MAG: type VI secretion system membrane subunit TssM [Burkholderiaceae bacterium]|nr:MAG: type VI secretion system membrane subunit TssM [Burkholderiaceae bacterium]
MKWWNDYKRWWIGGLIVLALSLMLWWVGPLIASGDSRPLESAGRRLLWIGVIVLVWLAIEGIRIALARRRNRQLIEQLAGDSEADERSQQEARLLAERFQQALLTLKSTKLGGQGGQRMLYQLPWYMFIGAPGSGKTTALVNSGLRFPLATTKDQAGGVGGVGGTRNCDWWFTDDAVLIDTAGRYTTQDSHAQVDGSAWNTFLGLLKRFRPRQPINGVFVTLSVGDLLSFSAAERKQYAQVVRTRVEELQRDLGLQFPVYIMVTKCDLVAGFNEFFSTLDATQRAQVWGVTFDVDLAKRSAPPAKTAFEAEVPGLVNRLNEILMARLQEERDAQRRSQMYPFPQQFAALTPLVAEFLEGAFGDSKLTTPPLVRGVYFTSGTQQGAPIDRLLSSLSKAISVRSAQAKSSPLAGAAKSFFIEKLLKDVIFPEAGLAGHSEQRERRLRLLNAALLGGSVSLGVGLASAWTWSYHHNQEGLARAADTSAKARTALGGVGAPRDGDLSSLAEALSAMRRIAPSVNDPVKDAPWSMSFGLYQARKVEAQVDERYRMALQQGLLPRMALQLERVMAAPESKPEAVYAALKAYLMLFQPKHLDAGYLQATMNDLWISTGEDRDTVLLAREHLTELVRSKDLQVGRFHPQNDELVASAREKASQLSMVDRAYSLLRLAAGGEAPGLRLSEVVGPQGVGVLERASGVSLVEPIPVIYTREGYRNLVKPRIKTLVAQLSEEEAWVLGGRSSGLGKTDGRELEVAVQRQFLTDYQSTWQGVLADIRVKRIDSMRTAMGTAQVLAQADSPLKRLVVAVADQTRLSAPDVGADAAKAAQDEATRKAKEAATSATSGLFGSQASSVINAAAPAAGMDPIRAQEKAIEDQFADLRRLVGDGKAGDIDAAVGLINEIFNELVGIQQKVTGQGLKELPPSLAKAKAQAERFPNPVSGAIKSLVGFAEAEAAGGVRKEVKAGVGGASALCAKSIPGRYPFSRGSGQDVGVQDFVNVFKSGGDLDGFFNQNLAQFVDKSGGVWRLKATGDAVPPVSGGTLRQFQNADAIRMAFLSGGATPSVTVDAMVVAGDAELGLDYDGQSHKLRTGTGSVRLSWPAKPGAKISLNGQPLLSVDGAWALFRLLDKGQADPSATGDRVRVSYQAASGAKAVLELRAGSAAFNPFRLREMDGFACPRE